MRRKVLISSGGSGGHIIPASAFYDHLKEDFDVLFLFDKRGSNFINKDNFNFKIIESPRLSVNPFKIPVIFINFFISIIKSIFLIKNNNIDILIGTGGYMSIPVSIAAKLLGIKIYLFEPNLVLGRANKFLIRYCSRIFCYSKEIFNFPKKYEKKIYVIDHILRKNIYKFNNIEKKEIKDKINLLIIGGSQGAKFFNDNLKKSVIEIAKKYKIKVYHQASSINLIDLRTFYQNNQIENEIFDFKENIFEYIKEANIAITRSGASTLSELAFLNVPFIAIPYKFAKDKHQLENALYYEKKDCCWILKEETFDENILTTLLLNIIEDKESYLSKKKNLENFFTKNKWKNINEKIINCLNEN